MPASPPSEGTRKQSHRHGRESPHLPLSSRLRIDRLLKHSLTIPRRRLALRSGRLKLKKRCSDIRSSPLSLDGERGVHDRTPLELFGLSEQGSVERWEGW